MVQAQQDVSRGGRGMTIAVSSCDTDSAYAVVETRVPAGQAGPPLHSHPNSDEVFVVLAGTLLLHVDGALVRASTGQVVTVPRGAAHTFATSPDSDAHVVTVHRPGGFEQFHVEAEQAAERVGRELTVAELVEIAAHHDWRLIGPPLLPSGTLAGTPS